MSYRGYSHSKFKKDQDEIIMERINEKLEEICEEYPETSVQGLKMRIANRNVKRIQSAEELVIGKALEKVHEAIQDKMLDINYKLSKFEDMAKYLDEEKLKGIVDAKHSYTMAKLGEKELLLHKSVSETDRFVRHALREIRNEIETLRNNK